MIVSGDKGTGKSTASMLLSREYIDLFGFTCPVCGADFYKNIYERILKPDGTYEFILHPKVADDTAWIECPIEYSHNLKTGTKTKERGCGHLFKFSQRKKPKWTAEKYIAYDNKDMFNKIFKSPKYSPIIADEAVKFAAGMYHNKADSKALKELFTMIRPKNFWFFFCIPEFQWIDSKYREHMSNYWLRMIERGTAVLFEKDKGEAPEKFHIKRLQEIMGTVRYFTPMDKIKRNLRKHPCYFDTFKFSELPEKMYSDYEIVRNSINLQRQVEEMELSNKDVAKIMTYHLMKNWDRIKIAVDRSRDGRLTYEIVLNEMMINPVTKQNLVSQVTMRNWIRGVENYIQSKGTNVQEFDGVVESIDI